MSLETLHTWQRRVEHAAGCMSVYSWLTGPRSDRAQDQGVSPDARVIGRGGGSRIASWKLAIPSSGHQPSSVSHQHHLSLGH